MKQKITKNYIQNHFRYQSWMYISLVLFATLGWSLIFSVTRYLPPEEKKIEVYFMDDYYNVDDPEALVAQAMETFPDMELIDFYNVAMSSYEGQQKFMVTLAANEGDVYIIDKTYLSYFTTEQLAVELDAYLGNGQLVLPGVDLSATTFIRNLSEGEEDIEPRQAHTYAIPADNFYGFMKEFLVDNRDKVILVTSYSGNEENAVKMIQWLYERYYYEETPDFVENYNAIRKKLEESDSFNNGNYMPNSYY